MPPTPQPGSKSKPPPTWASFLNTSIDLPSLSSIGWLPPGAQPPPAETMIPLELINPDPIAWMEQHFFIPETRGPIVLDDYQKLALRTALATDADGLRCYSTMVWSDIKKSAKSTLAAAVIIWAAIQIDALEGWGSFYIVANDLKQADSRVAYYLRRAILLNPQLRALCKVRTGSYKVTLPNQTFIEAIPIDPSGEAGSNADMVVFSELWGAHSKAQAQMWTEMTLPPGKFGRAFRWIETYAGVTGGAPILEQLYEQGVTLGRRLDSDLELYDNPAARLFCLWNTQPRLPWQTDAYYDQERAVLLPSEFKRVHRNAWSDGDAETFLPGMALWDACKDDTLPPLGPHERCVLVIDAGESNDTFALVIASAHPTIPGRIALRYAEAFVPIPGEPLNFDMIEDVVRDLIACYAVVELGYDPFLMGQMIRRLKNTSERTGAPPIATLCEPFNQGADRLEADKGFYDLITSRRLAHDGTLTQMREHVRNANKAIDVKTRRMRIVKRAYSLKIDLAVCGGMACARAAAVLDLATQVSTIPAGVVTTQQLFGGR